VGIMWGDIVKALAQDDTGALVLTDRPADTVDAGQWRLNATKRPAK